MSAGLAAARFVASNISRSARAIGIDAVLEPRDGIAGYLVRPDGSRAYFCGSELALNDAGAARIAADKEYTAHFLRAAGFEVPDTRGFPTGEATTAMRYAREAGLPVVVKPNSSRGGRGVTLVTRPEEFAEAFARAAIGEVVLVQQALVDPSLTECRIITLDGEVVVAYTKHAPRIVGDGVRTVEELLAASGTAWVGPRAGALQARLARAGATLRTVLACGSIVSLADHANLSAGGVGTDLTTSIHPALRELAVALAAASALRYCGVDLVLGQHVDQPPDRYWVLEVNSAPGLYAYSQLGPGSLARAEDVCRQLAIALAEPR